MNSILGHNALILNSFMTKKKWENAADASQKKLLGIQRVNLPKEAKTLIKFLENFEKEEPRVAFFCASDLACAISDLDLIPLAAYVVIPELNEFFDEFYNPKKYPNVNQPVYVWARIVRARVLGIMLVFRKKALDIKVDLEHIPQSYEPFLDPNEKQAEVYLKNNYLIAQDYLLKLDDILKKQSNTNEIKGPDTEMWEWLRGCAQTVAFDDGSDSIIRFEDISGPSLNSEEPPLTPEEIEDIFDF